MLDINKIEANLDYYINQLNKRNADFTQQLKSVVDLNDKRKSIIKEVEDLKAKKNSLSKEIGILMRDKKISEADQMKNEVTDMNSRIETLDTEQDKIETEMKNVLSFIPNLPNEKCPIGVDENDNPEVRRWNSDNLKESKSPHWEIAQKLNLVDFELGPKLSGSRFIVYTGLGSKMVRAIADIMLNHHAEVGYKEMFIPVIVNKEIMEGTCQLPKFEDDAYKVGDQYLIPTSEVPLTNIYRNEIIDENQLPTYLTAFTQCFRQEAGSAGRDTKGMIRLHQFNKVEMVKIVNPESSFEELEKMVNDAEDILKLFKLPYRVVELCTGDIGFSSTKTYDLEVWFPEQNKFREISSCSNCLDFQARRMMTRFKNKDGKTEYVHTLNGSGLAIDRLIAAVLENYYDGEKLVVPEVLRPYFNNQEYIK